MRALALRRGARGLLDDAVDRVRHGAVEVTLLHVLPSVPLFGAWLWWFVQIDLRGAMPPTSGLPLVLLLIPKMLGWGALAAWAGAAGRGISLSPWACWRRALARLPEVLFAGALGVLSMLVGCLTIVGFLGVPAAAVGLAATVSDRRATVAEMLRQGGDAATRDGGRGSWMMLAAAVAWVFLTFNLLTLPFGISMFGAGSLGFDMNLVSTALSPARLASWMFAGLTAGLIVEALLVVAFAELQIDREAEREGTRFLALADDLEARVEARATRPARGEESAT